MPATLDPTIGGAAANSYETLAEANEYFEERLPLPTPWVASGDLAIRSLIMATKVLDAYSRPFKSFVAEKPPYYRIRRQWTGAPATQTQRLAWPRIGMFDGNGNPIDHVISTSSVASPTVIQTTRNHGWQTGQLVFITGSNTTPSIDGEYEITRVSDDEFSIPVAVTVAGSAGRVMIIPQELKEAQSELAGQLLMADTTLDNSVIAGGIKSVSAGSVSVSFKDMIEARVLPDAVWNLMPPSWFTEELYVPAQKAIFGVVS
jgi:hypothetical protein